MISIELTYVFAIKKSDFFTYYIYENINMSTSIKQLRYKMNSIFERYLLYQFKLNNKDLYYVSPKQVEKLDEFTNFCKAIDAVLSWINKEYATLIKKFHIEKLEYGELGYSVASFYSKYKLASQIFLQHLEGDKC